MSSKLKVYAVISQQRELGPIKRAFILAEDCNTAVQRAKKRGLRVVDAWQTRLTLDDLKVIK